MKLESLWTYPIKSCAGIQMENLEVTKGGPLWDRHWMIVDENGQFMTQRQLPKMALIQTTLTERSLVLRIDGYVFDIPFNKELTESREVKVWKSVVKAWIEDPLIDNQLSGFLDKKVQLVRSPKSQRQFDIHFADSRPLQLANLESLKALNEQLSEKVTIERFRANIVVSGLPAFAEDALTEFNLGGMTFTVSKPCIRCNIINVDPLTWKRPHSETLVKLKEFHAIGGQPAFGVLLVPKKPGTLAHI